MSTTPPGPSDAPLPELPSVTAVVPTKDRPELLRRAVERILLQDYAGHIECLVVFDGTEPREIDVEVPAGRTLRTLVNTRKPGLAGNRNTGYLAATGDYVGNCDDDDEWLPGKITSQVEVFRRRPEASIVTSGMLVAYNGEEIVRLGSGTDLTLDDLIRSRHAEVHTSSFLMERHRLLEQIGLVDEDLPGGYGEDYEFLLRASRVGPVVVEVEPVARIHFHDASYFASRWVMIDRALTHLLDTVPEFQRVPSGMARIEGQLAFANAAMGERRRAVRYASRSLRRSPTSRHSYAALLVASGLVSADRVALMARRRGRGI